MFPSFIGILDIQSWWEVPSIAYFCSLFRTAFNLLDFDIEDLEEALLTDGSEECASTLLTELIVRLLNGCLGNNDISAFNYQMFLRRLFRQKCQETSRYNPFNTDIDFQFLPLRTKVEILYALCDFRLDAEDVFELFKNLEPESLRVEPLGWDDNSSAYWYFYGTRLYREDYKQKSKNKKRKNKEDKRKKKLYGDECLDDPDTERVWQVVCFTAEDWNHLTEKFKEATSRVEKELYQSLSENFLPEIPRLFQEKERLQRKRLLELAPRRTSTRVLQKTKQKEEEEKSSGETKEADAVEEEKDTRDKLLLGREHRAKRREQLRSKSTSSDSSNISEISEKEMPQDEAKKHTKSKRKKSKNPPTLPKGEPPPAVEAPVKTGRKTNNSLACATGQIVIPDSLESRNTNSTRKILKGSQIFSQSEEDIQTDMYKVLEQITAHEDAWPFMDPVEEEYAPNYYAVIRRPMDLKKMEERLDSGYYTNFTAFKTDFKLIVNNCRLYNGHNNEYSVMVDKLQDAFDRLTERYIHYVSSSDEEVAVEYQIPTPSRKHKMKQGEDSTSNNKKRKTSSNYGDQNGSHENEKDKKQYKKDDKKPALKNHKRAVIQDDEKSLKYDKKSCNDNEKSSQEGETSSINDKGSKESEKNFKEDVNGSKEDEKETRKGKDGKIKKKHHRHGKHSRCHKKTHKSCKKESKHLKKSKKDKHRKKKHKHLLKESEIVIKRSSSYESLESSNRSRSASPLPSIHSPTPSPNSSPVSSPVEKLNDPDFYKDKYDKIKERRRQATKDVDTTIEKHTGDKPKQNLIIPDKDKNQKLRETIEKLKAKNEKYKETLIFNNLFSSSSQNSIDKSSISSEALADVSPKDADQFDFAESDQGSQKSSKTLKEKRTTKKVSAAKNESATEALEQAVKDISKWLDNEPKKITRSSPTDSLLHEDQDSRLDDELSNEKGNLLKRDVKKRPSSREPKMSSKRRDVHRTIERLHPGKIKGNLITASTTTKVEDIVPLGPHNKPREIKSVLTTKVDELSPKLSLGSVLPTVGFTLGKDHKFSEEETKIVEKPEIEEPKCDEEQPKEVPAPQTIEEPAPSEPPKVEEKPNPKEVKKSDKSSKFCQEKATPNLSAWFKAFGAPKSTPVTKKKNEDNEPYDKPEEKIVEKPHSPKSVHKYDSPPDLISPTAEGGDSPNPNIISSLRQRRTSTGSSVSERSSFSQDLDSPRHQMAHTSPLLRSPASPRTDDFQKISYPIINGTVRAGFYQDTASIKSSPEKSCSPRDGPQSPYSPYSQHEYANNAAATPNPSYYTDINKSPLPTYGFNQPPVYYDTSKAAVNKTPRTHSDDYTAVCPDGMYQKPTKVGKLVISSPTNSPYSQHSPHSPYSQLQNSPQTISLVPSPLNAQMSEPKNLYPVKKRSYNEESAVQVHKSIKGHDLGNELQNKDDYQKLVETMNTFGTDVVPTSIDDIALSLSKKPETIKMDVSKENTAISYVDKMNVERIDITPNFNGNILNQNENKQVSQNVTTPDKQSDKTAVDMVNMGYFATEMEKRSNTSDTDLLNASRDLQKAGMSKGLDIGAIAMNLGINKAVSNKYNQSNKHIPKMGEPNINANILDFENIQAANQSVSNLGLGDFDITNKKYYSSSAVQSNRPIDYCNWKNDNEIRKTEAVHANYPNNYMMDNTDLHKLKNSINIPNAHSNYLNSPQYANMSGSREPMSRSAMQHNLHSELRIPNPRGMMHMDTMSDADIMRRNMENHTPVSGSKSDKIKQQQLATSIQYKPPYSSQPSLPIDTLRNIPVSYLSNEERYLSGYSSSSSSFYDKSQMAQMFKSLPSDALSSVATSSIYSQASVSMSKDNMSYKPSNTTVQMTQADKSKQRRKKTETKHPAMSVGQTYHTQASTTDALSSAKNSLVPGSAFNFGPSAGMALSSGLYSDSGGFSLDDFRSSTANQFMAANYMVAAAAAHQRNSSEVNAEKLAKPAHQNVAHSHSGTGGFPFIGHGQSRATYPFVGTDPSSPLYQQYLQRQEELLGAQIMGLYPPAYHSGGLGTRQPYDAINRPPWL